MSVEHKNQSVPEKIVYKGAQALGLIGGIWYLLEGNFTGAVVGAAVAFVASLLGSKKN